MVAALPSVLRSSAALHPDRPAVVWEGAVISYAELDAGVQRLAAGLAQQDVRGRRIGVLLPNVPTFPLALYGLLAAGGRAVMLNPANSRREVAEYLADSGAVAVLTTADLLPLLPAGSRALLVDGLPGSLRIREDGDERELSLDSPGELPGDARADDEAVVLYTAANAGWARGAALSHGNLLANLRSTVAAMQLTPDDRVIAALPLIHAFGLTVCLNAPLSVGAAVLPVERFNPLRLLERMEEADPTVLCGVPAMYLGMLAAAERRGVPRHSLRVTLCGGAPLDVSVARRWEDAFGLPLRQGYGLTEAGPVSLFNRVDRPNRPGTLGYPFPAVEVSIRDASGAALPQGEVGEICVRGENVFHGYLGEAGRSARDFHEDWLRTGDLGSEEPDGAVKFRGVAKPMFTRNGFNVYPREVERVLTEDPRIEAAAVCALPDPARENEIVVIVRAAPGAEIGEADVRELCRTRLAAYKQPTRVEIEAGPGRSPASG